MSTKKEEKAFIFSSGGKKQRRRRSRGIGARIQSSLGKGGNVKKRGVSLHYLK